MEKFYLTTMDDFQEFDTEEKLLEYLQALGPNLDQINSGIHIVKGIRLQLKVTVSLDV